jgi:hypothetical protein
MSQPLYSQGKSPRYPLDMRLGGLESRSWHGGLKKNSQPPPKIKPQNPVAKRYTDWAIAVLHLLFEPRHFETFRNNKKNYGESMSAPHPTLKLEDHLLSAVRDCLFNKFTVTLRTQRTSWIGVWVGSRAGPEAVENIFRECDLSRPAQSCHCTDWATPTLFFIQCL